MTAEELIEANSLPAIEHYHTVPVVPESIAIKALEMKETEHQEKIREVLHVLKESRGIVQWMWDNMRVVDQNLQSDAFNLPANAITHSDEILGRYNKEGIL